EPACPPSLQDLGRNVSPPPPEAWRAPGDGNPAPPAGNVATPGRSLPRLRGRVGVGAARRRRDLMPPPPGLPPHAGGGVSQRLLQQPPTHAGRSGVAASYGAGRGPVPHPVPPATAPPPACGGGLGWGD